MSWGDSCRPAEHRIGGPSDDGLFPYSPGIFGTGASFAVRADVLQELGGFDEALGAGTRTAGGEDLDAFVRIVLAGHTLVYEPAAVVWHQHRSDLDGLRRQMFAYGTGLSAFLAKHLLDRSTRRAVLTRIPRGLRRLGHIATGTRRSLSHEASHEAGPEAGHEAAGTQPVPTKALLVRELVGFAVGPVLYVRARGQVPLRPMTVTSPQVPGEPPVPDVPDVPDVPAVPGVPGALEGAGWSRFGGRLELNALA